MRTLREGRFGAKWLCAAQGERLGLAPRLWVPGCSGGEPRGRGGCFGIRFVAGVVKISYKAKIFAETNNLRESGAEAHVVVDADPSAREWRLCAMGGGYKRLRESGAEAHVVPAFAERRYWGRGIGASGGCVLFHGGRVARGLGWIGEGLVSGWGCDGGTAPRRAPALGSRFRGNDGGGGGGSALGGGVGGPSTGSGANGVWEARWGGAMGGDAPRRAPALGSRFRGNDGIGGRELRVLLGVGGGGAVGVGGWLVGFLGDGWLVVVAQSRGGAGRSQLGLFGCLVFLVANGLTEVQYFAVI